MLASNADIGQLVYIHMWLRPSQFNPLGDYVYPVNEEQENKHKPCSLGY